METAALVLAAWVLLSIPVALLVGAFIRTGARGAAATPRHRTTATAVGRDALPGRAAPSDALRILVVDDDPNLRSLLEATLRVDDVELREAHDAESARFHVAAFRPHVVILDVGLPGTDGLELCHRLKADPATREIAVVLLTGSDDVTIEKLLAAGADGFVAKPFSPLALLETVRRVSDRPTSDLLTVVRGEPARGDDQMLLFARDLRKLLDVEHRQRVLLQKAYAGTALALARALESKDLGTREHAERVTRYALELARTHEPALLHDPGIEYGFLLHDVGKIGIPDAILGKRGPLEPSEQRLLERHTILGEQMLGEIDLLAGEGIGIVRHHHERWDGCGYPDGLAGEEIPLGARLFAVADALDAMTSDRPYRRALSWATAVEEILEKSGTQFAPTVVESFRASEPRLRRIHDRFRRLRTDLVADPAA
jgi:response regulator RpfG family c-di-GMP phosphodiesterase